MHTVLVVEDEPLVRIAACLFIEEAGFSVVEAANADAAIKILESRSDIRLIFTDVDMPGSIDGLKLAHFVRHRWPPIKIIVASGKTVLREGELPAEAIFFSKPYSDGAITRAIATALT